MPRRSSLPSSSAARDRRFSTGSLADAMPRVESSAKYRSPVRAGSAGSIGCAASSGSRGGCGTTFEIRGSDRRDDDRRKGSCAWRRSTWRDQATRLPQGDPRSRRQAAGGRRAQQTPRDRERMGLARQHYPGLAGRGETLHGLRRINRRPPTHPARWAACAAAGRAAPVAERCEDADKNHELEDVEAERQRAAPSTETTAPAART